MINAELQEKIDRSIARAKMFCPEDGYYLAFSGGKDSVVCKQILIEAGVPFDAVYNVTSVDPPELVRFVQQYHPDVKFEVPTDNDGAITMWKLIVKKGMPPMRTGRYCCHYLKESAGDGRIVVTGVRWAESNRRAESQGVATILPPKKKAGRKDEPDEANENYRRNKYGALVLVNDNADERLTLEHCVMHHKVMLNVIIDWEQADVWNFIRDRKLPYCSLYDEGFSRLGCIGCPLGGKRSMEREFARWPKYREIYLRTFQRMQERRVARGKPMFDCAGRYPNATPEQIMKWWLADDVPDEQMTLMFEEEEYEEDYLPFA